VPLRVVSRFVFTLCRLGCINMRLFFISVGRRAEDMTTRGLACMPRGRAARQTPGEPTPNLLDQPYDAPLAQKQHTSIHHACACWEYSEIALLTESTHLRGRSIWIAARVGDEC